MHVVKSYPQAEQDKSKTLHGTARASNTQRSFQSGSGLHAMQDTAKNSIPASQRSNVIASNREVPSSSRRFANNYAAFYNVQNLPSEAADHSKAVRAQLAAQHTLLRNTSPRLNTGMQADPNFVANKARFYGAPPKETDEFYKAYRAYYAATPQVKHATHMGEHIQDQQKSIVRNRLAENAKRILNTKSFDDGVAIAKAKLPRDEQTQKEILAQSGFAEAQLNKTIEEPASYQTHKPVGELGFQYKRQPFDSVCKGDPPIKNLDQARYNIITGSVQPWF